MIEWGDLRYYLAVADAGSALAAARKLGVDQSTISRRIAVLERELGVKLFNKTRSGFELTVAGRDLLARARNVEAGVAAFLRSAADHETGISGTLRLTTAEGIAYGLISPILDTFHRRHPALHVTLLLEDRFLDLAKGEADVAVRAGRPSDPALFGRKLTDAAWAVYAARSYVERHGAPSTPADLNKHHIIALEGPLSRIGASTWLTGVAPGAKISSRSNSILGALLSAKSGIGVAVLPVHVADPETELMRLIDPVEGLMGEFWVLTHPEMKDAPRVRAFTDFLAAEIKKYRPLLMGQSRERTAEQNTDTAAADTRA
jgi:DNA-binding transcriptional LysR family regulator